MWHRDFFINYFLFDYFFYYFIYLFLQGDGNRGYDVNKTHIFEQVRLIHSHLSLKRSGL